jgi:hypothetical protein
VLIPCILLNCIKGLLLPFLVDYSYKGNVNLTHLFCLKDANGNAHDCGATLFAVGMYLLDPFSMKRRPLLDAVALELL